MEVTTKKGSYFYISLSLFYSFGTGRVLLRFHILSNAICQNSWRRKWEEFLEQDTCRWSPPHSLTHKNPHFPADRNLTWYLKHPWPLEVIVWLMVMMMISFTTMMMMLTEQRCQLLVGRLPKPNARHLPKSLSLSQALISTSYFPSVYIFYLSWRDAK